MNGESQKIQMIDSQNERTDTNKDLETLGLVPPANPGEKPIRGAYPWGRPMQYNVGPYSYTYGMPEVRYVYEFHHVYQHPIADRPTIPAFVYRQLRAKLILEEFEEYLLSCDLSSPTIVEAVRQLECCIDRVPPNQGENFNFRYTADALGDMVYVIHGAAISMGIPMERVMHEIHKSNLTKLDENGEPIFREDGKVLKSHLFKEPDLSFLPDGNGFERG